MPRSQAQRTDGMTGEYPENWGAIAGAVKAAANDQCIRCHHAHDVEAGFMLTVHHLDMNKVNCQPWNLLALCQRCHLRIQAKVDFEQQYMFGHSAWLAPFLNEWRNNRRLSYTGDGRSDRSITYTGGDMVDVQRAPLSTSWRAELGIIYEGFGDHDACGCSDWQSHNGGREPGLPEPVEAPPDDCSDRMGHPVTCGCDERACRVCGEPHEGIELDGCVFLGAI